MKKKLILGSSMAAMSLAAVLSLTSCGGMSTKDVKYVKSDILDTTLVTSETSSNYYTKYDTYYGNTVSGGYVINTTQNKIYNFITSKSITFDNLSNYSADYKSFSVSGYGSVNLLLLTEYSNGTTKKAFLYDNNLEKVAEVTMDSYSSLSVNGSGTLDSDDIYNVTGQYSYYDSQYVNHTESFNLTADKKTGAVKLIQSATKDPRSYQYSKLTKNVYYQSTPNKENTTYSFYDSSYNELCTLDTNVYFSFNLEFKEKVYLQGIREVAEDYKDAICVYDKKDYAYYELKTYCLDITNKKIKEINPEVVFGLSCNGNKDSDYFVANYYKIENNFVNSSYMYTGFFKDGELEYKLPITITDVETNIKKIGEDYLITSSSYKNLYNKDMEAINAVRNLNKYNIYSDNKNFKTNFYKANGEVLYSTENDVDTNYISTNGLAYETKDGDLYKILVFSDSAIKTVTMGENDSFDTSNGFIVTNNENGSYTIKQPGSTASLTLYGSGQLSIYSSTSFTTTYYVVSGDFYTSATTHDATTRVSFFVGR